MLTHTVEKFRYFGFESQMITIDEWGIAESDCVAYVSYAVVDVRFGFARSLMVDGLEGGIRFKRGVRFERTKFHFKKEKKK